MRERPHTQDRPFQRIQDLAITIMKKRKMTSRIGSSKKRQFTLLSIVLRRDPSTRESRHQILDQVPILILTIQITVL
jgi:hypothetical protein